MASLRQQWGRAGRREAGLAVLIASEDALDQFFMREPEALLGRRVEAAILDHTNPRVLDGHVRAAAFEAPIAGPTARFLGEQALVRAEALAEAGELKRSPAGYAWAGRGLPGRRALPALDRRRTRSPSSTRSGQVLGLVEEGRAFSTVHEGAVYLHLGESYAVLGLDLTARVALVEPFTGDYYTQTKRETETVDRRGAPNERRLGLELSFGAVSVTEQVIAYQRRSIATGEQIDLCALDLPPQTFETEAVWFCPEPSMLTGSEAVHGCSAPFTPPSTR